MRVQFIIIINIKISKDLFHKQTNSKRSAESTIWANDAPEPGAEIVKKLGSKKLA